MSEQWQQWQATFAGLSLRERLLILVTGLLVIILPSYYLWIEPASIKQNKAETELAEATRKYAENADLIEFSKMKLREDPNKDIKAELLQLHAQLEQVDKKLELQQAGLIPVEQMTEVLEKLLQKSDGLMLVSMDSLAPEAILSSAESSADSLNFYRHGIRLKLNGGYFPLVKYLQVVEELPQRFLWQLIDYQVLEYPRADITIDIYTLSTNKDFISG
ncbi:MULTISPECIES: type II secretion system protein GspM [unclassified Agarivorans]|uniref:type II secretion system protein GspM n=1 Tax=unclassified Agarivorans TaxID=2636026 RepID=UPI0026E39356|nr:MULTISPECIES: type II secretion system protein GspM [unclassified Agarivorans]MDO6686841.1 type II secretion system protein GspM [Agarivorans sp. 3_MG-2023]MDO6716638.1 type II secretion system protein GspM [Agarivorans sp. 2_MG-2023]MDO6764623.1 type II secretion system protein GspM [Agarivorans sp. 1_MG-2023]